MTKQTVADLWYFYGECYKLIIKLSISFFFSLTIWLHKEDRERPGTDIVNEKIIFTICKWNNLIFSGLSHFMYEIVKLCNFIKL